MNRRPLVPYLMLAAFLAGVGYVLQSDFVAPPTLQELAEGGELQAQLELADRLYEGELMPEDRVAALGWYLKAAEQGDAGAQLTVGIILPSVAPSPNVDIEAAKWIRRSADQGHPGAALRMGFMCKYGHCVPRDLAEATRWFIQSEARSRAEGRPNPTAWTCLGVAYLQGDGVPKDRAAAMRWFHQAAEYGQPGALIALGDLYLEGQDGRPDKVTALSFYAAVVDNMEVQGKARSLERTMTADQIREAYRRRDALKALIERRRSQPLRATPR